MADHGAITNRDVCVECAVVADTDAGPDDDMRMEHRAIANGRSRSHHHKRANGYIRPERGCCVDGRQRTDARRHRHRRRKERDCGGTRDVRVVRAKDRARRISQVIVGDDRRSASGRDTTGKLGVGEKRDVARTGIIKTVEAGDLEVSRPVRPIKATPETFGKQTEFHDARILRARDPAEKGREAFQSERTGHFARRGFPHVGRRAERALEPGQWA